MLHEVCLVLYLQHVTLSFFSPLSLQQYSLMTVFALSLLLSVIVPSVTISHSHYKIIQISACDNQNTLCI